MKPNIVVKIFQLEFFFTDYESIDSGSIIEKSMNLSLLPLFVERDDNDSPATLYHIPVNHHGISDAEKLQNLIDIITNNNFNTVKDMFHFHVYRTKQNNNKNTLDMLVKFNNTTSPEFGKRSIELQQDEYKDVIGPFLDSILCLNIFKEKDFNLFAAYYKELQKRLSTYISKVPTKSDDANKIQDNQYVQNINFEDYDNIKTVGKYNKFVKVFQSKCPIRFGIVEGLHRTKALLTSIFERETISHYSYSSNNVIISSSTGKKSKRKTYEDLVRISHIYKTQKEKTFGKTSLDNLRDLQKKMSEYYKPEYTIQEQLKQAQNNKDKKAVTTATLYNADRDIMNVIRKFLIELNSGDKKLSNSWDNTIKKEPQNALHYICKHDQFDKPQNIKNPFKMLPSFYTMKEKNSTYSTSSFAKMFQENANKASANITKNRGQDNESTFLYSELTLCQFFLRASVDSAFKNLLTSCIDFEVDETIHTVPQLELNNHKRECMDLDVLSKYKLLL